MLYIHGWNDYFFQTHVAEAFTEAGIDFFALDLRRYGRSLPPGPVRHGFITDLDDYGVEIGEAVDLIAADHDRLILVAHSTGGLIASLWAAKHPERVTALVLNSPWLDLQGSAMVRALGTPVIDAIGHSRPTSVLRLPDTRLLRPGAAPVAGRGVGLRPEPEEQSLAADPGRLAACHPARSPTGGRRPRPQLPGAGDVLDPDRFRGASGTRSCGRRTRSWTWTRSCARATRLGRSVTIVRVDQGLHDVWLSAPAVRKLALDEMLHWVEAYALQPGLRPQAVAGA